jgi:hypothetical protein
VRKETDHPLYLFMVIPVAITATLSIIFCIFPNTFYIMNLVKMAVKNLFGGM